MYLYLALLDKFSCLIVYNNFIVCLRVFLSSWLMWSSTIQLRKWSKTPSNMLGSSLFLLPHESIEAINELQTSESFKLIPTKG
jgi:hypothetical protein